MDYPWAIPGAKVVYIGPSRLASVGPYGYPMGMIDVPLTHDKVYTIYDVQVLLGNVGIQIAEYITTGYFNAVFFRPLSEKDSEMFNEMLNKLPRDLIVEDLSKRIHENLEPEHDHVI